MKRVIMLLILCTGLFGCSKSPEQREVEKNIRGYEAKIEEALLMDNGYQDSKFTNVREDLDEYLTSSRDKYDFEISSPYEGLRLDEALEYYNDKNGTSLINLTKEEAPKIQEELEAIEERKEESKKNSLKSYQLLIDTREEEFHKDDTSIGRYVWLEAIARYLVSCEGNCTSDLLSYEDAQKWIETGEYNVEWTYIDGKYASPPATTHSSNSTSSTTSTSSKDSLEQEAEEYFANVSGVNLNRFEGITPNYDDYEYVTGKYCFNKKGTLQSESKIGSTTYQIYSWDGDGGGVVTISFIDGVVSTKTQFGLK